MASFFKFLKQIFLGEDDQSNRPSDPSPQRFSVDSRITKPTEQKYDPNPPQSRPLHALSEWNSQGNPPEVSKRTNVLQVYTDHTSSAYVKGFSRPISSVEHSKASPLPSTFPAKISLDPSITKPNEQKVYRIPERISSTSQPEAPQKRTVHQFSVDSDSLSFEKSCVGNQPQKSTLSSYAVPQIPARINSISTPEAPQNRTVHQSSVDSDSSSFEKRRVTKQPQKSTLSSYAIPQIPARINLISPPEASQNRTVHKSYDDSDSSSSSDSLSSGKKWVVKQLRKSTLPVYAVPDDLKDLIKKDKVPGVLTKPVTASTYSDYFAALLYAEDYYIEKWNGFLLSEVTLQLHEDEENRERKNSVSRQSKHSVSRKKNERTKSTFRDKKPYVAFEIDSIPERRPFLLSRDFVFIRPSGKKVEPFQGSFVRVAKSTRVLAEFGDDFHSGFSPHCKYDVSFSFNRVCLKRSHQAIAAALDPSFHDFLFPSPVPRTSFSIPISGTTSKRLDRSQLSALSQILSLKGAPPYLVEGPSAVTRNDQISITGLVIIEAILQIYNASPNNRILVAASKNRTCDELMRTLQLGIPESELFRANAAFRDLDDVPEDILPSCLYEGECFACPSLYELCNYRVITSTYISSFRLRTAGLTAGHFSHIFIVDASSATEPETMVALTNLADQKTAVVVSGTVGDRPDRVRSDIARRKGLMVSYFQRLLNSRPYSDRDPLFVKHLLQEEPVESDLHFHMGAVDFG